MEDTESMSRNLFSYRYNWAKAKLIYEKSGQLEVSGVNTCYNFMQTVVEGFKDHIKYSAVNLDIKNQTEEMLKESSDGQEYYSGKNKKTTLFNSSLASSTFNDYGKVYTSLLYLSFLTLFKRALEYKRVQTCLV